MPFEARLAGAVNVQPPYAPSPPAEPIGAERAPSVVRASAGEILIRLADIVISLAAILFLLPGLVAVALLVKVQDGGPILFAQSRIGKGMRTFKCLKFRSMRTNAGELLAALLESDPVARAEWEADHKLRNDPRITPLGGFMRKTSLDELPQLFNVLWGDMSLVGPRPIVEAEVVKYGRSMRHYCRQVPGITGLWQVMGRNDVSYRRRVALDRLFTRKLSLKLYAGILCLTIPAVLLRRGSY
jgi:lipopolysaccharide/colanic/teichoic acid biosynthesis glycosyltransferase